METHHELIIIIIQCLWAVVGSPSKREDDVGANLGPVQRSCQSTPCLCLPEEIPDFPLPGRIEQVPHLVLLDRRQYRVQVSNLQQIFIASYNGRPYS